MQLASRWNSWKRRWAPYLPQVVSIAAWCIVLGLAVVAGLRLVAHDASLVLVWLNTFTFYLYLPVYFVFALALYRRDWRLAAASSLVVACHLAWVAPDFRPAEAKRTAPPAADASSLRVVFVNAYRYNQSRDELLEEVVGLDPDVVVLAEFWGPWQPTLLHSPVMTPYEFGTDVANWTQGDVIVRSRIPLENLQSIWAAGRAYIRFDVSLGGRALHFLCLHSPRPMYMPAHDYRGFWQALLPAIAAAPRPLVVLGDFNSTQHSRIYQQMIGLGLRSVHAASGRGFATTWPNGKLPLPPIRIDHAFLSPEVEWITVSEGTGVGTDHRPLILDLRLRNSS